MSQMPGEYIEKLYVKTFRGLTRRVQRIYRLPVWLAEEIVQEAFLIACVRLDRAETALGWVIRTIDNLARNELRRASRKRETPTLCEEQLEHARTEHPARSLDAAATLDDAFRRLFGGEHAKDAVAAYAAGDTLRELAVRYEIPEGTLYRRVSDLRSALRITPRSSRA